MSEIPYQQEIKAINDSFSSGTYEELPIIFMNENNYFNATKLAQIFDKPRFKYFVKTKAWAELCKRHRLDKNEAIITVVKGSNDVKGTYIHPKLLTFIFVKYVHKTCKRHCIWIIVQYISSII